MGKKGFNYVHTRTGDTIKVEVRDSSERVLYRNRFKTNDEESIYNFLQALEKFNGLSIQAIINKRNKMEWI